MVSESRVCPRCSLEGKAGWLILERGHTVADESLYLTCINCGYEKRVEEEQKPLAREREGSRRLKAAVR